MDFQSLPDKAKGKTGQVQPSASTANLELLSFLCKDEEDTNHGATSGLYPGRKCESGGNTGSILICSDSTDQPRLL